MKTKFIRFLLSLSSFSGVIFFLFVGKKIDIPYINALNKYLIFLNDYILFKYVIFLLGVFVFAGFSIWLTKAILNDNDNLEVKEIKPIEGTFLPVYIGLFVVALSFENNRFSIETGFLLLVLFLFWTSLEAVSYFNPFLLIFGYRFYEVKSKSQITFTLISKIKDIKKIEKLENLIRINNFTFIQK